MKHFILEKAKPHKYLKRVGVPGRYQYKYEEKTHREKLYSDPTGRVVVFKETWFDTSWRRESGVRGSMTTRPSKRSQYVIFVDGKYNDTQRKLRNALNIAEMKAGEVANKSKGDFVSIRDIVGTKRWRKMGKEEMKPMKGIPADWGEE